MAVFNRRNAVVGWATWMLGKRALKRKAMSAVDAGARHPRRKVFAVLAAAAVGGAAFFRRRSGDDDNAA
jgi:hypothetical protein